MPGFQHASNSGSHGDTRGLTLSLKLSSTELKSFVSIATAQTHFLFKGSFYDQIDGVAMGSSLAPVLANLFMGHHVKLWL